jgi:hypothetical protein
MGLFCELLGHSFEQPWGAEAVRSSDGALMVHGWTCWVCRGNIETYEPMDAFIARNAEWAERSGGSKLSPPVWLGPPRPGRFPTGRVRERAHPMTSRTLSPTRLYDGC